ncbi:MAG: hypothetical protein LBP63_09065 [Prevotellaceae bacterium]|jgi:hypothetical protein|nr:hypothetical protein [Prevotellaceae bacterium]
MKKLLLQTTAILLILAGVIACEKEEKEEGNVPYAPCPCEGEEVAGIKLSETALLVADSVRELILADTIFDVKGDVMYYAVFNYGKSHDRIIVYICNFPDFAKEWDIPPHGREIYLSGKLYNKCFELPNYLEERCFNMVLTNIKLN